MKNVTLLVLLLSLALPAQATLMQVTGSFSGAPVSGASIHWLSGSFTAYFDDTQVTPTGYFGFDNLTPANLFLNNPLIGNTNFDRSNTYLDLKFYNGNLTSFLLGDLLNDVLSPGTDDFSVYVENNGAFLLSGVAVVKKQSAFFGIDVRFNDPRAGSFFVSAAPQHTVPDFSSTAALATLSLFGLLTFRSLLASRYSPSRTE